MDIHTPFVSYVQPSAQRRGVGNELQKTGLTVQGYDFVSPDAELTTLGLPVTLQHAIDDVENLLHNCILPQVIVAALELRIVSKNLVDKAAWRTSCL